MRLLVAILFISTMFSCGEKDQFILNGHIKGVENDKLVLGIWDKSTKSLIGMDTVAVENGDFVLKKKQLEVNQYILRFLDSKVSIPLLLENGMLELTANADDAKRGYIQKFDLKGSKNHDLIQRFNAMEDEILEQEKYAQSKQLKAKIKHVTNRDEYDEIRKELNKLSPNLNTEVKAAKLDLIKNNLNQFFVVSVFPQIKNIATIEQVKEVFNSMPETFKLHHNVTDMMKDIKIKESIQPGKLAPDFTLKTPTDEDLSLSDLRGKIVLVDFWASWCKPCRASFPHMKELYQKYHTKGFEVLGVTNDTNHKAWKKAIKDDELPWLNVADQFPPEGRGMVIGSYGMDYLPSTVLIDREGVIIAKLIHGDELDKSLEDIFGF
ncbi:redoxin domain-containing protein [Marinifilum sp.]|uniref:redoxin domain-containing protein n=1 Tax=Marinifilum sp. TaxID=2033137 RepID=UPI003BA9533E